MVDSNEQPRPAQSGLVIRQDQRAGTLSVFRTGRRDPILTQNARPDARPYLHPIATPDGKGVVTEFSPDHHKHQTGLYWGFTRVNGRDYFHNPQGDYWRRVSFTVTQASGNEVRWQTVYDLLDEAKNAVLTETARWSMREENGRFLLDLEWRGEAKTEVVVGKYDYGGLFLRMPWREGMRAEVVNAARQRDARAEGQRAMWIDVAMQVEGRERSGARRDLRPPRQPGVSAGLARRRSVRRRVGPDTPGRLDHQDRRDRSRPPSLRRLHRHAQRRRVDEGLGRLHRQPVYLLH